MERETAWAIVCEFVKNVGLRRHMLAVESAMRGYAARLGGDAETWGLAGLLHDFDWEIHPTLEDHPAKGALILRERGVPEEVVRCILAHNEAHTGVRPESAMERALLACDEVTGLIIATALVRPTKDIREVEVKSVQKKWKLPAFAAGVDRPFVEAATRNFADACFGGQLDLWRHVKLLGGTGRTHNWVLSRRIHESIDLPLFLAGGLNPANVFAALDTVRPFAVDVCSGLRTDGRLDETKLSHFMSEVRRWSAATPAA